MGRIEEEMRTRVQREIGRSGEQGMRGRRAKGGQGIRGRGIRGRAEERGRGRGRGGKTFFYF